MSEFQERPLEDITLSSAFGPRFSGESYNSNGNVATLRTTDISEDGRINYQTMPLAFLELNKFENHLLQKNDLVITRTGRIGSVALFDGHEYPVLPGAFLIRYRLNHNHADSKYILYFLMSQEGQFRLQSTATGSVQQNLNITALNKVLLPIPPLPEQRAIASVLSSLDDKIDLLHRQNTTLEAMAETLFRQWFVEEADEGWEEVSLKDICVIFNGYAFQSQTYTDSGQKIIRTLNFTNHWIELDGLVHISDQLAEEFNRFYLQRNDFLLVMVGASLGNFAIVTQDILPALQNQNMWRFRANSGFSQHYLNYGVRQIISESLHGSSGSAREFFQKGVFYELKIPYPPIELLNKFEGITETLFSKIELNRYQIRTLSKLRDTLLPKLMSGEVRVEV